MHVLNFCPHVLGDVDLSYIFFEILHGKLAHARPKLMHLRMPDA